MLRPRFPNSNCCLLEHINPNSLDHPQVGTCSFEVYSKSQGPHQSHFWVRPIWFLTQPAFLEGSALGRMACVAHNVYIHPAHPCCPHVVLGIHLNNIQHAAQYVSADVFSFETGASNSCRDSVQWKFWVQLSWDQQSWLQRVICQLPRQYLFGSLKMGVPQSGWFSMEKSHSNGWFRGIPLFGKPSFVYTSILMPVSQTNRTVAMKQKPGTKPA